MSRDELKASQKKARKHLGLRFEKVDWCRKRVEGHGRAKETCETNQSRVKSGKDVHEYIYSAWGNESEWGIMKVDERCWKKMNDWLEWNLYAGSMEWED